MTKLDALINKLIPDGVEFKELVTLAEIGTGSSDRKDSAEDGKYPFYVRSKDVLRINSFEYDEEAIVIPGEGGIGEIFHYVSGKYALHQRAYRIHPTTEKLSTRFLYYYMFANFKSFIMQKAVSATVTSIRKPMIEKFEIPVPPLEIQNEIVRILDNFTELEEELEEELETRRRQYEWAKQKLLNIKKDNLVELQSVCRLEKGKTPIQKAIPGEYPLVVTTDKRSSCKDYQFDCKAVCLSLVSARGHGIAQISRIFYQEGKFALGNILCAMIPNDENQLNAKFLQYYLFYMKDILLTPLMKGGANVALHISDLQTVKIPLPPIQEQEKIVSFLNKFDELCNDETTGLPAEIKARKKQYEYYRDKLLSFKKKEVSNNE